MRNSIVYEQDSDQIPKGKITGRPATTVDSRLYADHEKLSNIVWTTESYDMVF